MDVLTLILITIAYVIIDYFIIKIEIKQNIDLFYALHQREIIRVLSKERKVK